MLCLISVYISLLQKYKHLFYLHLCMHSYKTGIMSIDHTLPKPGHNFSGGQVLMGPDAVWVAYPCLSAYLPYGQQLIQMYSSYSQVVGPFRIKKKQKQRSGVKKGFHSSLGY